MHCSENQFTRLAPLNFTFITLFLVENAYTGFWKTNDKKLGAEIKLTKILERGILPCVFFFLLF